MAQDDYQKEQLLWKQEREEHPDKFKREPLVDSLDILASIGIKDVFEEYPIGYIKLLPQDFIVEEISHDKLLHTINTGPLFYGNQEEGATYYADLVKIDMSTLAARDVLADILKIDVKNIGYAGIKDRFAITSQLISIRKTKDEALLSGVEHDAFFLKNIKRGKGAIGAGELSGNRFTITIRSQETLNKGQQDRIKEKLDEISKDGFWNFFSFQRFGTPRLLSHILGRHLLRREYEETIKVAICYPASREFPYVQEIRKEAEEKWGDWEGIKESMERFPLFFALELSFLEHLSSHPNDFLGALKVAPDQIRLWVYAYASLLFNKKLSQLISQGEVPLIISQLTSTDPKDWEPYEEFLKEDGVNMEKPIYRDFPFIRFESRTLLTLQKVEIHQVKFQDNIMVLSFTLPKGAYATTLLSHLFQIASEVPVVPGIPTTQIDAKELLGEGSIKETLSRFQTILKGIEEERKIGNSQ